MDNNQYDGVQMAQRFYIDEPEQFITPSPKEQFEADKKKVNRKFIITATQPEQFKTQNNNTEN